MTLVLSHIIGIGSVNYTWISFKVCFIHRICVQQVATIIYFASIVDKEMEACFSLTHDTKHFPKRKDAPEVLFLS